MVVDDQHEVIAFLSNPGSYRPSRSVERIDTHSAIVFLAGDRAYKLKRAVQYDYLDFSTRELRRAACEREAALNRRTAPGLYLGVLAIARDADGRLAFDGPGSPVDCVVHMVRFDQSALFDRLASRGALTIELMETLADVAATAHAGAPPRVDQGGSAGMAWVIDGNEEGFRELEDVLDPERCREVTHLARTALDRHGELLETRRTSGRVRECHGDLHLRNIVMHEGRPTLFDAVEFNDRISCIDVLYDAAFLIMDVWRLQLRGQANACFNQYMTAAGELAAVRLLPLFLSCRSAVRAKTSATAARLQPDSARADELRAAARSYLSAAEAMLRPEAPRLVAIGGLSGTGKSTLARAVSPGIGAVPGALVFRSDVIRKSIFGVPATERLGQEAYAQQVTEHVYAGLATRADTAVRAGHSVIVDAVFADPLERSAISNVARAAGVPFTGLWLEAPLEVSAARIRGRWADASDATVEVLERQHARSPGEVDWIRLDASADADALKRQAEEALERTMSSR